MALRRLSWIAILFPWRRDRRLEVRNRELEALQEAGLLVSSELGLDAVLQKVVEAARSLVGARYGALSVIGETGAIETFITSGISPAERERIGAPPTGKGLLGVVLREGQSLCLGRIEGDPRSCGMPPSHPTMHSLLAVPVACRSPFRGNLYLSEKLDGTPFSQAEVSILERFAVHAAVAIDNADLHRRCRGLAVAEERLRIAHEIHDGQAQILAYVNAKAQAAQEYLRLGHFEEAGRQLSQLATAARELLADVREGILGLRSSIELEPGLGAILREFITQWQDQCGIVAELEIEGEPRFDGEVELQLIRIVQEALANVRKHAEAGQVRVLIAATDGGARITVEDDGKGFNPGQLDHRRQPRFGLATMRERAAAIGATLALQSRPGGGTRIDVVYPGTVPEKRRAQAS